jgi:Secretion system C-terminal sorting domain
MKLFLMVLLFIPCLAKQRSIMHRSADRILRSELSDPENLDWTKIRTWLHNKYSKESEYAIVESWMLEGNTSTAEQVFDAIPSTFNLTGDGLVQHDTYEDWLDLRISFKSQQKDIYNLGSSDVLLIQNIADNSIGRAAAQTQGLLNHQYGYNYMISNGGFGGQPIFGPNGNNSIAHPENLVAFPNPANEEVNFRYRLREGVEESLLTIHDLEGHLVASIALQGSSGTVLWETKGLSSGIYYYKADEIEGIGAPQKLVLIK